MSTVDLDLAFAVDGPASLFTVDLDFDFAVNGAGSPFTVDLDLDFAVDGPAFPAPDCFLVWDGQRFPSRMRIATADGRYP